MTKTRYDDFPTRKEIFDHVKKNYIKDGLEPNDPKIKKHIDIETDDIVNLTSPLREDFLHWWKTGELKSEVEVRGFTVKSIAQTRTQWDVAFVFMMFAKLYQNPDDYDTYMAITRLEGITVW